MSRWREIMRKKEFIKYYWSSVIVLCSSILLIGGKFIGVYFKNAESFDSFFGIIVVYGAIVPIFLSPVYILIQFIQILYNFYKKNWIASKHYFASIVITLVVYILDMNYTYMGILYRQ